MVSSVLSAPYDGDTGKPMHDVGQNSVVGVAKNPSYVTDNDKDVALRNVFSSMKVTTEGASAYDESRSGFDDSARQDESRSMFDSGRFSSRQTIVTRENVMNASLQRDLATGIHTSFQRSPPPISSRESSLTSLVGLNDEEAYTSSPRSPVRLSLYEEGQCPVPPSPLPLPPPSPTPKKSSKRASVKRLVFGSRKESGGKFSSRDSSHKQQDEPVDNIGLRLSLPSAVNIMTGKEPPPPPSPSRPSPKRKLDSVEEKKKNTAYSLAGESKREQPSPLSCMSDETVLTTNKKHGSDDKATSSSSSERRKQSDEFILRSCEMSPSHHQVAIPPAEHFLMHTRVCAVMESYSNLMLLKQNTNQMFDFNVLAGRSRIELEGMYTNLMNGLSHNGRGSVNQNQTDMSRPVNVHNEQPHPSILKSLLECADDLVVEGYFSGEDSNSSVHAVGRDVEVTVFSSQRHRQFIVCYRGSHEHQEKPISRKNAKNRGHADVETLLHPAHPVPVYQSFRDKYFANDLENGIFTLLDKLTTDYPFCDVVTTGHSFGAALATIGALRYAALYPMMTVSCHAFGSPRVGGTAFRQLAHSLPNLKVMRVENGEDPYVYMPEGGKWMHVGHTITVCDDMSVPGTSSGESGLGSSVREKRSAVAYRFDAKRPEKSFWSTMAGSKKSMVGKSKKMKRDHEIRAYVNAIENFTHLGLPWVTNFAGEEGVGISGIDAEARCVV